MSDEERLKRENRLLIAICTALIAGTITKGRAEGLLLKIIGGLEVSEPGCPSDGGKLSGN